MKKQKLESAALVFAKAWASWHETSDLFPDKNLINASNGILEALGLEMAEFQGRGEKVRLRKIKT